ncbi:MAG: regulatory protein RecX [Acidobacteriia bacterium]|nr:regulatory protein RecX [Terriglobia bacterium]
MSFSARKPKKLDREALLEYALRTLTVRALTTGELRQRLQRRSEVAADVDATLDRLKEYGYLNDQKFADNFAAARRENQGFGKQRVLRDLRQRRVAPALAEKAVAGAFSGTEEEALILGYLKRKFRKLDLATYLSQPSHLASAFRKLLYAGFSAGTSIRVLRRYSELASQLEDSGPGEPEQSS